MPHVEFSRVSLLILSGAIPGRSAAQYASRFLHTFCRSVPLLIGASVCGLLALAPASTAKAQALSTFHCGYSSIYGSFSDPCEVTLTEAAAAGGLQIKLSSNDSAAAPPKTVTVAAGSSSLWFAAAIGAVSSTQTATLTATQGSVTKTLALTLHAAPEAIDVTSIVNFGAVKLNTPATQSLVVASTGENSLTISSAKVSGTGFKLSNSSLPATLKPGQTTTLEIQFDPATAGQFSGQLAIASNSSSGGTTTVSLIGSGAAAAYSVDLSWSAPESSPVQIAGYRIYRANGGSSSYAELNSSLESGTSYTDSTVQAGVSYDYYVESVDAAGVSSAPSSAFAVAIP